MRLQLTSRIKALLLILTIMLVFPGLMSGFPVFAEDVMQNSYAITLTFDKEKVTEGESVNATISVKNTGTAEIKNLELRVPFYNTVKGIKSIAENPGFNKILSSGDYPPGFNNRSWLIDSLAASATKNFSVTYTLSDLPQDTTTLVSKFKLPAGWSDPASLESGKDLTLDYFRLDLYSESTYKESFKKQFPAIDTINSKVAGVRLSSKYYFSGSKTTDFKNIKDSNIKAYSPFILDTADTTIEWTEPIDFSSQGIIDSLKKLDTLLKVEWGKVEINTTELSFLLKPAKITFKNLDFINEPKVRISTTTSDLKDAKGEFSKANKTVVIKHDEKIQSTYLAPNLSFDSAVVQTNEKSIKIKGKATDSQTPVEYSIDGQSPVTIGEIDLATGEFEIPVNDTTKAKQISVTSTFKNNKETTNKVLIVKHKDAAEDTPTPVAATSDKISLPLNPITLALLFTALGLVFLIAGIVYFLYFRKNKLRQQKLALTKLNAEDPAVEDVKDPKSFLKDE